MILYKEDVKEVVDHIMENYNYSSHILLVDVICKDSVSNYKYNIHCHEKDSVYKYFKNNYIEYLECVGISYEIYESDQLFFSISGKIDIQKFFRKKKVSEIIKKL